MENNIITANNPWKGLNFYKEGEILYGRNREIETLTQFILANTQTVIYGKSGIGKTSILNAGIFPVVRERGLIPVSIRFDHNSQDSYLKQVQTAVVKSGAKTKELVPVINPEAETLWEYLHRNKFEDANGNPARLMFVFDQFEEIFTLQHDEKRRLAFFAELADVLNDVTPQYITQHLSKNRTSPTELESDQNIKQVDSINDVNLDFIDSDTTQKAHENTYLWSEDFHMVFILREDFLSYLERYTIYIPVMKSNRVALLPLNEEQAAEIITRPQEGLVSTSVAELIIRKVTGNQNFTLDGVAEIEVDAAMLSLYLSQLYNKRTSPDEPITAELVDQFGNDIIKDFYESSIAGIPAQTVTILEDELLTYDGRRNNVSRKDLIKMGVPEATIDDLVENKKLLRQFTYDKDMRIEYMHDTLCKVVTARVEQREAEATRAKEEAEKARVAKERERQLFLSQEREQALKRQTQRMQIGIAVGVLFLSLVGLIVWDGIWHNIERHYGSVTGKYGWFVGNNRYYTEKEASYQFFHYVLKYRGRWSKHPYSMEARDGYGNLTTNHNIAPYILNQYDETDKGANPIMVEKVKTICQWEFVMDETGKHCVQTKSLDKDGKVIFAYNETIIEEGRQSIGTYTDEYGFPLLFRDSSYYYVRTTYDHNGYPKILEFYDEYGYPITNRDGAFQTRELYTSKGIEIMQASCFLNGKPMKDRSGNCGYFHELDKDSLRVLSQTFFDINYTPCRSTKDSIIVCKYTYDKHGRVTEQSYWDENDNPDTCITGYHSFCYEYNDHGQVTHWWLLDINGNQCTRVNNGALEMFAEYDKAGHQVFVQYNYENKIEEVIRGYQNEENVLWKSYTLNKSNLNDTVWQYVFEDNKAVTFYYDAKYVLRETLDERGHVIRTEYFDINNEKPIASVTGYHLNEMPYQYCGDTTFISDICYDLDGNIVYHHELLVDSIHHAKAELVYDLNGKFKKAYRVIFADSTFRVKEAQESTDENWQTFRTYDNGDFYYRANLIHSIKPSEAQGNIRGLYAVNEFGEPSLIYANEDEFIYHAYYIIDGNYYYYDENGKEINPDYDDWDQVAYIELNSDDSVGFHKADIILACNDWCMWFSTTDPLAALNERLDWWDEIDRNFIVARFNPLTNGYDTAHVFVPAAVDVGRYVGFKRFRCSVAEKERIKDLIRDYIYYPMTYAYVADTTYAAYQLGLRGDMYILDFNGWNFETNEPKVIMDTVNQYRGRMKHITYIDYKTDTIGHFTTDADTMGLRIVPNRIHPAYYNFIKQKYLEYQQQK